jgi:hypothetical protein
MRIQSAFEQAGIFFRRQCEWRDWRAAEEVVAARLIFELVKRSQIIRSSLNGFSRQGDVNDDDLYVRRGLELAGGGFIDENGGGPGVCLRSRPHLAAVLQHGRKSANIHTCSAVISRSPVEANCSGLDTCATAQHSDICVKRRCISPASNEDATV